MARQTKKAKPRRQMKLHYFMVAATYDPVADAAYIYLNGKRGGKGSAAKTLTTGHHGIYIDLDRNGRALGMEILGGDVMPAAFVPEQGGLADNLPERKARRTSKSPPRKRP